jgi:hypothetical protein
MTENEKNMQRLIAVQESLNVTLHNMEANLKTLNDSNILHVTKNEDQHKSLSEQFNLLMNKYWYILVMLIVILGLLAGAKGIEGLIK